MAFVLLYQNCSQEDVLLSINPALSFNSPHFPLIIPEDGSSINRYIFLVDMSFSMVSGPCYQDIDANMLFNRDETRATVDVWDPNRIVRDRSRSYTDYRQVGAYDCYVNPDYDENDFPVDVGAEGFPHIPSYKIYDPPHPQSVEDLIIDDPTLVQNSTIKGSDFDGLRLTIVKKWIKQLRDNLEGEQRRAAQVLIIPYTSGAAMKSLINRINLDFKSHLSFLDLEDPRINQLLNDLEDVHKETKEKAIDPENFHRWKNPLMGTSSPAEILDPLYEALREDMTLLSDAGGLEQARYDMIFLSDGKLTPIKEHVDTALKIHKDCNTCIDPDDENSEQNCPGICGQLKENIEASIGQSDLNDEKILKFKMNRIQNLRRWFGSGRIVNHFVQVNDPYYEKVYRQEGNKSLFEIYYDMFKKYRYNYKPWVLNGHDLPFDLATGLDEHNYLLTGIIILNSNVRINTEGELDLDSDGDGLFDHEEKLANTDPLNPRSDGVCLDSISVHEAHKKSCAKIVDLAMGCSPYLDSDMDSLNECEEELLGTNPFDFDTDGDLIPDYFEWIYKFNPLLSDKTYDTNSDGIVNIKAFLSGLNPNQDFNDINENYLIRFKLNERFENRNGQENLWTNTLSIDLENFPFLHGALSGPIKGSHPSYNDCFLYRSRVSSEPHRSCELYSIDLNKMFFGTNSSSNENTGIALAKLRDKNNDQNIKWKIMKFQFSRQSPGSLNLANFVEFKVIDEAAIE